MSAIDLDAFRATRLERQPYDHLVVPGFLRPVAVRTIGADYPKISKAGSYPLSELKFGAAFAALIEELRTPEIETAFAEKFDIDLAGRPTMITVRGQCRAKDGRIHTDTEDKLITERRFRKRKALKVEAEFVVFDKVRSLNGEMFISPDALTFAHYELFFLERNHRSQRECITLLFKNIKSSDLFCRREVLWQTDVSIFELKLGTGIFRLVFSG